MLSAMAVLLSFATISCDMGLSKVEKYGYKLKEEGKYIELNYDSNWSGYYCKIPLDNLVGNQPIYGNTLDASMRFYIDEEFDDLQIAVIDNWYGNPSNWQGFGALESGSVLNLDKKFVINTASGALLDSSRFSLYFWSPLRTGETPSNNAGLLRVYYDSSEARFSISEPVPITVSLHNGKVIAETDLTGKGIKITLNGTNDNVNGINWWEYNRYNTISIKDGFDINFGDDNHIRPNGEGDKVVIYYPFVSSETKWYELSFNGESGYVWTKNGIGEVDLSSWDNIKLDYVLDKYPMAIMSNVNDSFVENAMSNVTDETLKPYFDVELWGGTGYDHWTVNRVINSGFNQLEEPLDLIRMGWQWWQGDDDISVPAGILNSYGGYWYRLKMGITSPQYGSCNFIKLKGSSVKNLSGVTQQQMINEKADYDNYGIVTRSANYNPKLFTFASSEDDYRIIYLKAGYYILEWLDYYGRGNWNGPLPSEWSDLLLDEDTIDADFYLYDSSGDVKLYNDFTYTTGFTVNADGEYKIKLKGYSGSPSLCHGAYHIYKNTN